MVNDLTFNEDGQGNFKNVQSVTNVQAPSELFDTFRILTDEITNDTKPIGFSKSDTITDLNVVEIMGIHSLTMLGILGLVPRQEIDVFNDIKKRLNISKDRKSRGELVGLFQAKKENDLKTNPFGAIK